MIGKFMRKPKMPAPRKFQKPTATRNITAQRCGNGVGDFDSCRAPSCKKLQQQFLNLIPRHVNLYRPADQARPGPADVYRRPPRRLLSQ
jgi:hypothetical protein